MRSGVFGEFSDPKSALSAIAALQSSGHAGLEAFGPYPVRALEDALRRPRSKIPRVTFAAALMGIVVGYGIQSYTNAVAYPLNVGGRPLHSGPTQIPITFETCVLFGAAATVLGLVVAAGLGSLWHPVFEVDGFESASIDKFWVAADASDPAFDRAPIEVAMRTHGATRVEWLEAQSNA